MSVIKEKLQELIEGVPDENDPDVLSYWQKANDNEVYLEGWADLCLAGTGFPPMEEGETARKVAYIEDLTPEILQRKAKERGLKLIEGGFKETPDAENLYGVTYGIYESSNPEIPKTRVTSLGFAELELPVARAVEVLVEERPVSSGFHEKLNQRWTVVFWDIVKPKVAMAAQKAGLEVSFREAPIGTGHYFTDISLPNVGKEEIKKATAVFNRFAELYEANPGGGSMDEIRAKQIAEEAGVTAASLVGSQIAKEVAKQQEESLHGSPITERGKVILGEPPLCYDFRGTRSWVLTRAWQIMEKEKRPSLPVGEAWSDVRRVCAMSPERVEAKKAELCELPHMEQIPACERYAAKVEVPVGAR